ncbi:MAG TPA: hypothetical protein VGW75_13510 [Solirubrobacteraceae bacterium]|jgi:hypothetical protein|nr:hypothetical protein [Solirubrobacteraceae bacterium]
MATSAPSRRVLTVHGALCCSFAFQTANAAAYVHVWDYNRYSGQKAYDWTGQVFNRWLGLRARMPYDGVGELCAKGETAHGNIRSGNDPCGYSSTASLTIHGNCLVYPTPESQAYVYFGANTYGQQWLIEGRANTDGCTY